MRKVNMKSKPEATWTGIVFQTAPNWAVALGVLLMIMVCIIRGLEGERFKLPWAGDEAEKQAGRMAL